jgi:hypothetical protein
MLNRIIIALFLFAFTTVASRAQTATLRGVVTDQSGAVVPNASVSILGPGGQEQTAASGADGAYVFRNLPIGNYTVDATAPEMKLSQQQKVLLQAGVRTLDLKLSVASVQQQVSVEENAGPTISTEASSNASAIALSGKDLDALSDDPDQLQADLIALAGPAAGPSGGSIYIDGFSGGELPPKNAIREVRINQNPFSPEYDKLGYGRIEIFTKPGTDKFRVSLGYNFATDKWNSRNPYAAEKAPFLLNESRNTLSGPIGNRASFTVDFAKEWVDNGSVINGVVLDPATLTPAPYTNTYLASLRRTIVTPRVDYQLSPKNTLSARYSYRNDDVQNAGVGGLNLASTAYHYTGSAQTVQITETAMLTDRSINETRFQYYRPITTSQANTSGFALRVLGSFIGGASNVGYAVDTQNNYELQNYTSILRHNHTFKFGVRFRGSLEDSIAPQNFNGTFTFSGGVATKLDENNQVVLDGSGQPVQVDISSIESYRRTLVFQGLGYSATQVRQLGGGASQFTISAGTPASSVSQVDLGAFFGDEWKVKPNLNIAYGIRYETQSNIHDWSDFAYRMGVAWAPHIGGSSGTSTVIRAGIGIFYDRFSLSNTLLAERFNGVVQQQFIVRNPDFFPKVPDASAFIGLFPTTVQNVSPIMRAPYLMQSAIAVERQLPHNTTMAVTYANTHGLHQLRSLDTNAPLIGTYDPTVPGSGVYPLGRPGQVLVMESSGLYNQNQVSVNANSRINQNISLAGSYTFNRAMSNTDSVSTFPANPYSMEGEYGPAVTDVRHYVSLTGSLTPIWGVTFSPMFTVASGPPFDITVGGDLYGDGMFNARPGIAMDASKPGVVATKYGLLDPQPTPDETLLSRNFGRGPGQIMLNMRVGRTFGFGGHRENIATGSAPGGPPPGGGGGSGSANRGGPFSTATGGGSTAATVGRHYNLAISMQIRNLLNHNNPGPITGNITSPLFGLANQSAGDGAGVFSENANNRRLELQTRFTF